jgi:coenzyme F420-reducing hydrogenase gamma subunit
MSRKTALRVDEDTHQRPARVSSKSRGRRSSADGQLVGEVIAIAFDRCEALGADAACGARPDALCTGCGTARCPDHGVGSEHDRSCSTCAASLLSLAEAPFDVVLDTRLRLVKVRRF